MLRVLEAQAPTKQNATDSITVLGSRLNTATLLEDRRAAILGLRSFAKEYPASVASEALRGLISSLSKDVEDVDTTKIVLETLLMLFNPDSNSPESSPEIALWLADEFTQRQENITILLDLLENIDFYSRLYSLQLISAISSARPDRTQECVLSAPLGTTRLVAILDDSRDAIRNAGLLLLTDVTQYSVELQKLVGFENCFDRVFAIIESDGSLLQGGIIVQDCLSLLANLLRFNSSNQSLLRESGGVEKLAALLPTGPTKNLEDDIGWESPQKDKNIWGLLAVLRLFLVKGSTGTQANQDSFYKAGVLQRVLDLAFENSTTASIKGEALSTCAEIISGNAKLQENFAQIQVALSNRTSDLVNGNTGVYESSKVYIIDSLLNIIIRSPSIHTYTYRSAASELVKAYFYNHHAIKLHFLRRAVDGHNSGQDETPNFLSALISGQCGQNSTDSLGLWFSASLALHLLRDFPEGKELLMTILEGDAENGEDVLTCIQALSSNLITGLQRDEDERMQTAYLMLLCVWLFEYAPAVNDFLGEGSTIQRLIQEINRSRLDRVAIRGLCVVLLGIVYEYSTKDSPISRRTLQSILNSDLGRERYLDIITQLRQHRSMRDFDAFEVTSGGSYYDALFVDFFKDNFSRLVRSIDRDPNLEVHVNHNAVDRNLMDDLQAQMESRSVKLQKIESELLDSQRKLDQEQADRKKDHDMATAEILRMKKINDSLHRSSEIDVKKAEDLHNQRLHQEEERHRKALQEVQNKAQKASRELLDKSTKKQQELQQQNTLLQKSLNETNQRQKATEARLTDVAQRATQLSTDLEDANKAKVNLQASFDQAKARLDEKEKDLTRVNELLLQTEEKVAHMKSNSEQDRIKLRDSDWEIRRLKDQLKSLEETNTKKEVASNKVQSELDDLLIMLGDLEEKHTNDKKRLKELGADVSEDESDADVDNSGTESGEAS